MIKSLPRISSVLLLLGCLWYSWGWFSGNSTPYTPQFVTVERELVAAPQWKIAVNDDIRLGVERAKAEALSAAKAELESWHDGVMKKVDAEYLDWHFDYFNNLISGLTDAGKGVFYSQERIERDRQKETAASFSAMVMPPLNVEHTFRHIAELAITRFQEKLPTELSAIRAKYSIPTAEWEAHLENIVVITRDVESQTDQPLSLKTLAVGGTVVTAGMGLTLAQMSLPMIDGALTSVGLSLGVESVALAESSVFGGPVVMSIAAAVIVGWEILDHRQTVARNKPLLRAHIEDYLRGFERDQLKSTGVIGAPLHRITANIARSLGA